MDALDRRHLLARSRFRRNYGANYFGPVRRHVTGAGSNSNVKHFMGRTAQNLQLQQRQWAAKISAANVPVGYARTAKRSFPASPPHRSLRLRRDKLRRRYLPQHGHPAPQMVYSRQSGTQILADIIDHCTNIRRLRRFYRTRLSAGKAVINNRQKDSDRPGRYGPANYGARYGDTGRTHI